MMATISPRLMGVAGCVKIAVPPLKFRMNSHVVPTYS